MVVGQASAPVQAVDRRGRLFYEPGEWKLRD